MLKLAIAIVLLPSKEVTKLCLAVNKEAFLRGNASIRLGLADHVPHISLAMGCIERTDLPELKKVLGKIRAHPIKTKIIAVSHFDPKNQGSPKNKAYWEVKKTRALLTLQRKIAKVAKQFLLYEPAPFMFFKPREIKESTLISTNQYMAKYGGANYHSHISLKSWGMENRKLNISFIADRLAVFQLGEGCTCRKKLYVVKLRGQ